MKVCKGCQVEKVEVDFYAARGTRDGLHGKCKECMKARQKEMKAIKREEMKAIKRAAPPGPAQQPRDEPKDWSCRANINGEAISIQISGPLTAAQAERVRRIIEAHTVEDLQTAVPAPPAPATGLVHG